MHQYVTNIHLHYLIWQKYQINRPKNDVENVKINVVKIKRKIFILTNFTFCKEEETGK